MTTQKTSLEDAQGDHTADGIIRFSNAKSRWNLRFDNAELEQQYLFHMIERDRILTRCFVTITLIAVIFFNLADLRTMPADVPRELILARIPAFFLCWLAWFGASFWQKFTPKLPWFVMCCVIIGNLILTSSQWISGLYGAPRPYQTLLLVPLFAPLVGCMPWRIGIFPCIASALMLAVPEIAFQPDPVQRDLHLVYIALAILVSLFTSYVHERLTRRHFLISNTFLEQSRHDPLTGLSNRRELDAMLPRLMRQAVREKVPVAIAMVDVDHFKAYNDHYGHAAGDTVLATVARAIAEQSVPLPDYVARYGGEEFFAIWFNPRHDTKALGEGLRRAVEATNIEHTHSSYGHITISIGLTCRVPEPREDGRQMLADADSALYAAKNAGRNQVVMDASTHAAWKDGEIPVPNTAEGMKPFEPSAYAAAFAPATKIGREERNRWMGARGIIERSQLSSMVFVAFSVNLVLILANLLLNPDNPASLMVKVQGWFIIPLLIVGFILTFQIWALRLSRHLVPFFITCYGIGVCLVARQTFLGGHDIPYEFLIFMAFQTYMVGSQSWISASLVSVFTALLYLSLKLTYLPLLPHLTSLDVARSVIPFFIVNVMGILIAYIQDKQSLDGFLKQERLETLALQDALTGLANRQGLTNYQQGILPLLTSSQYTLTVAMVDVDYFKRYNDHYGHAAGDAVLASIGKVIRQHAGQRPYDFAGRYGGEEFILIWYQCDRQNAALFGERIRAAIYDLAIPHIKSQHGQVTASVGLVQNTVLASDGMDGIKHLIEQADQMLYEAKVKGRNCVVMKPEHLPEPAASK